MVVHRRLPDFEERAPIAAWIYEIARRIAHRYRTRAARDATRTCELPELPANHDPDRDLDQAMAAGVMQQFLWALDEDRRRAFVLSEFSGMPGREIAEALGVNMNTIYARVRSARLELDRTAKRMRAQDSASVVRALRQGKPPSGTQRRTWAAVAAVVGGSAQTVGLGLGGFAWAIGGLCVGGAALAWWAAQPTSPSVAFAPTAVADAAAPLPAAEPSPKQGLVKTHPLPAPAAEPRLAPGGRRQGSPTRQPSLAKELRRLEAIRGSIKAGQPGAARAAISTYRGEFPKGALRQEVDALDIELACRTHATDAQARVAEFRRTGADEGLLVRLEAVCDEKIAPQKPRAAGIDAR